MSLLPSKPDLSADSDPRVVGIEGDDADELLSALSSETARRIVAELHEDPAAPSELADRVDTTLQNVQYHLSRLDEAGVVKVAGTAYSEKGREMDVYAPADQPLVIVAAEEEETSGLRAALSRLLGGTGALLICSVAVQQLFGEGILPIPFGATGGAGGGVEDGGGGSEAAATEVDAAATATPTPTQTATEAAGTGTPTPTPAATGTPTSQSTATATEAAAQTPTVTDVAAGGGGDLIGALPPGLLFFLGGFVVLVAAVALSYGQTSV